MLCAETTPLSKLTSGASTHLCLRTKSPLAKVLRDSRLRKDPPGKPMEVTEKQSWAGRSYSFMAKKRKCADDAPSAVAKRAKRTVALPRLASRDVGLGINNALRGSRNKTLKAFLPDSEEKKRAFDDELRDGEQFAPTLIKCQDEEQKLWTYMPSPGAYMRSPRNEPIGNRDPISSFGLGSHVGFSTKRNCKVNGDTRTSTSKKPKPGTPRHMELGVMFGTARLGAPW